MCLCGLTDTQQRAGESDGSIVTGRYTADYLRCGNTAVSGCGTQRRFLSHRRIRRYLVLPLKAAEKHVTSSHVRFTPLFQQKKSRSCRDSCFENPGGGLTGKLFPTGNKQDILDVPGYGKLPVTLIDCANPVVIFKAEDAGLNGTETCIGACSVFIMLQKYLLLCWEGVRECFRSTPHQAQ